VPAGADHPLVRVPTQAQRRRIECEQAREELACRTDLVLSKALLGQTNRTWISGLNYQSMDGRADAHRIGGDRAQSLGRDSVQAG
jgi:hypothetical protein